MLGRRRVSALLPECAGREGAVPSPFKAKIKEENFHLGGTRPGFGEGP